MTTDSLSQPEIFRDTEGVPHIRAQNWGDAFFAQGYIHAQDRIWQMDAARRQISGRWSEWVGVNGIPQDTLMRRLGGESASRRDYEALSDEARRMVDEYARGVNAYLAENNPLPLEYELLGESSIERWDGWHCIAAMRQRGALMGSVWFKLWRAAALTSLAPDQVVKLRYDDGGTDRLCWPQGTDGARHIASIGQLQPAIDALLQLRPADESGGGSNNWAIGADRTASGSPLLAGDPHRVFEMPSMYAQMHLACDEFDAIGLTVPGVPGFPHFGHNKDVGWCVTHAFADIHDLYIERFAPHNSRKVEFRGAYEDVDFSTETIQVRDGEDVSVDVIRTRHGAIVAGDPALGTALALKSVQFFDIDLSLNCILPTLRARDVEEFYDSSRAWGLIDHNVVTADTSGNIGYMVRAKVPRRSELNGWLPVPGWTGEHEWDGYIAWDSMPKEINPERGFIATANNRVVADLTTSGDYFATDCHPPHRVRRIEQLLDDLDGATVDDMATIHRDVVSAPATLFRDAILKLNSDDSAVRRAQDILRQWDGSMDGRLAAPSLYSAIRWHLARNIASQAQFLRFSADPLLTTVPPGVNGANQIWWTLPSLLRDDDCSLLDGRSWDDLLVETLRQVSTAPEESWASVHRAQVSHPLGPQFPDHADVLNPAGAPVSGDNETVCANGAVATSELKSVYGAVARYAMDVSDWNASRWIVVSGASGDPRSDHYFDQHQRWSKCEMAPMLYDWAVIERQFQAHVIANPQGR